MRRNTNKQHSLESSGPIPVQYEGKVLIITYLVFSYWTEDAETPQIIPGLPHTGANHEMPPIAPPPAQVTLRLSA